MKKLKLVGLLTIAALAMSAATGAAGASASGFVTNDHKETGKSEYPALTSSTTPESPYFVFGTLYAQCNSSAIGQKVLSSASKTLTTTFGDSTCTKEYWAEPMQLKLNGCALTYDPGAEVSAGEFEGTYGIGGESCTSITLKRPGTETNYCYLTIPQQSGIKASFVNSGKGNSATVTLKLTGSTLKYTAEGKAFGCPKEGEHSDGHWSYIQKVSAVNETWESVGLAVSATAPTGFFHEGGKFKGEAYPLKVAGAQTEAVSFSSPAGIEECASGTFSPLLLSSEASTLSPVAEFADCTMNIGSTPFKSVRKMNGCGFVFQGGGTLDISCSKAEEAIKVEIYTANKTKVKCTLSIGAQEGLKGLTYSTVGSGGDRGVKVAFGVSGVSYTADSGLLNCGVSKGLHTDGSFGGSVTFYGGVE